MFVNYSHPSQLHDADFQRKVKSYTSSRRFRTSYLSTRHPKGPLQWTQTQLPDATLSHVLPQADILPVVDKGIFDDLNKESSPSSISPRTICSGGLRTDPFNSFPIASTTHVTAAVDYYVQVWVPSIGSLPGGSAAASASLKIHFPWVMQDGERFESTVAYMLCSMMSQQDPGHHLAPIRADPTGRAMLLHRGNVLASLHPRLTAPQRWADDTAIHTVCTLMTIDFLLGNDDHLQAHSKGLAEMIRLRGGVECLGLNGIMEDSVRSIQNGCKRALAAEAEKCDYKRSEIFLLLRTDLSRPGLASSAAQAHGLAVEGARGNVGCGKAGDRRWKANEAEIG